MSFNLNDSDDRNSPDSDSQTENATRYGSSSFGRSTRSDAAPNPGDQASTDHPDNVGSRTSGLYGQKQDSPRQSIPHQSVDNQSSDCECETDAVGMDADRDQPANASGSGDRLHTPEAIKAHARSAKQHVQSAASEVGSIAHEAAGATRQLREKATQAAEYQRGRTADVIDIIADAIRDAGKKLMEEPRTREVGIWSDIAADKVCGASGYLRSHDASTMMRDASQAARKHPELFLGAMATAGLALARFIKASSRHEIERRLNQGAPADQNSDTANANASFAADADSDRYAPTGYTTGNGGSAGDGARTDEWNSVGGRISDAYRPMSRAGVGEAEADDTSITDPTPTTPDTKPRLTQTDEEI